MARFLRPEDTVVVDTTSFEKFMDYRQKNNLNSSWGWMTLPAGTLMEVKELIFRTTGRKKKKKFVNEDGGEDFKYSRGRSCWVKCKIVTPISHIGEEHTIPSWVLKKSIVSHVSPGGLDD
tara:strand:- start:240 stop:599 length:360 start_codon:yes stop_codon:yes gene_type:complete